VLVGGVYSEEDKEVTMEGRGGRNIGGGDGGGGGTAPEETKSEGVLEEMMLLVASLYFCFNISVLTALSSACKD
jgi:hypothetical protein